MPLKDIEKNKSKFSFINLLPLTLAGIINAIGVTIFLAPVKLFDSGLSGTSFLLSEVTPLSLSILLIILNFPFYIFAFKQLGKNFVIYSLYTIAVYSFVSFLIQSVIPLNFENGSPIAKNELILCALFGGMISGIGSGITIRFDGALDGVEVMAVIFSKKIGLTVGKFVMIYNAILYIVGGIVLRDWILPLYSILAYVVGLQAVDFVVEGLDKAKAVMIVSNNSAELAHIISDNFGKGITIINGKGFYSKTDKSILYCVVNRFQISKLKKIILSIDDSAFVTITEISDVLGSSVKLEKLNNKKEQEKSA